MLFDNRISVVSLLSFYLIALKIRWPRYAGPWLMHEMTKIDSLAVCTYIQSVVVSVCQVEYLQNLIDDFMAVGLSERLHAWLILRSHGAVWLQHSLSAASGLGPEQRLHLARTRTRGLWVPKAPTEAGGWESAGTIRRARLDCRVQPLIKTTL